MTLRAEDVPFDTPPEGPSGGSRFTLSAFAREKLPQSALGALCLLSVGAACVLQGVSLEGSLLVVLVAAVFAVAAFFVEFARKRTFYDQLAEAACGIGDAVAAASMVEEPEFLEGRLAYDAVVQLSAAANGQVGAAERDAAEYRRYIEAWVHEVKTPIAAAKLVLTGLHGPEADRLATEMERIESQVEQALFYARSSFLASDYAIGKANLAAVCREACKHNSRFLIGAGCTPAIAVPDDMVVLSDRQWAAFLLSQVVVNAAKYGAKTVTFSAEVAEPGTSRERTVLEVADDGCGIPAADVPRVFEMGFVGENGRARGSATGLGLYLVARLAEAMGIGVAIASEEGVGTRVLFEFPHDLRRLM